MAKKHHYFLSVWLLVHIGISGSLSADTGDSSGIPQDPAVSGEVAPTKEAGPEGNSAGAEEESSDTSFAVPSLDSVSFESDAPFEGHAVTIPDHEVFALSSSEVDAINGAGDSTWVATTYEELEGIDLRSRTGAMVDPESFRSLAMIVHDEPEDSESSSAAGAIPPSFDARTHWPSCSRTIGHIRDQGQCGSCWAVSSAGAMTDRLCIHKRKTNVNVASTDLINCCGKQCSPGTGDGCQGGWMDAAFNYWRDNGLPSEKCQKYVAKFGQCTKKCDSTPPDWSTDRTFASKSYRVKDKDAKAMQTEIMKFGTVVIDMDFYPDFASYKSGVYQHAKDGTAPNGHAMRIIGWGEENGLPYWLVANSWGTWWGDKGFIKILRGSDNCGIETYVIAGLPR